MYMIHMYEYTWESNPRARQGRPVLWLHQAGL